MSKMTSIAPIDTFHLDNNLGANKTELFSHQSINYKALRERAYNLRWATLPEDVIPLTAADPDFPIAPEIITAIQRYAGAGVFSYGPADGLSSFRNIAAEVLRKRKKVSCKADLILPIDGAASGMFTIAKMALKPGDEAIVFDPVDFLFQQSIEAAGGKVIRLPFDLKTRTFNPDDLYRLISPRTKMICICNPHNPIGRVLNEEELSILGKVAVENKLWIMNDEIWSDIVYSNSSFHSIVNVHPWVAERTITVHGFSKTFGLAGLRMGYIVTPNEKVYHDIVTTSKVASTSSGVTTISQIAATAAYQDCWYWADAFLVHLEKVRDYAVKRLNSINGLHCVQPEGTYVLFVNIESFGISEEEMAAYLLKHAKVAVVPGAAKWFGPGASGHIRLCFSTSMDIITTAIDRIEYALMQLRIKKSKPIFDSLNNWEKMIESF